MYTIDKIIHTEYGNIIQINLDAGGLILTSFAVVQQAKKEHRLWKEQGIKKIRFLIDNQILTIQQVENWAIEEYKKIPKCDFCAHILKEDIFTNQLSNKKFCSIVCNDKDYIEEMDKLKDEFECDFR